MKNRTSTCPCCGGDGTDCRLTPWGCVPVTREAIPEERTPFLPDDDDEA